jgi:hypothetical protein
MTPKARDLQLTAYAARDWRANFFPVGIAHCIVGGSAWEQTPWPAVQRAGWDALKHTERNLCRVGRSGAADLSPGIRRRRRARM